MKRGLVLILAVCSLTIAMVPRERRAVNTEEDEERLRTEAASSTSKAAYCSSRTPCQWVIYSAISRNDMYISNSQCKCKDDESCLYKWKIQSTNSGEYYCGIPGSDVTDSSAAGDS